MPHAFPAQFFLPYIAMIIPIPKLFVVIAISFVKGIKIGCKQFIQRIVEIHFAQGFVAVGFKIPKGVVEVEKKVFVCFCWRHDGKFLDIIQRTCYLLKMIVMITALDEPDFMDVEGFCKQVPEKLSL
jgi:hypothetical protein